MAANEFSSGFAFLFVFLTSLAMSTSGIDPTYLYHQCSNTTTFAPNTTYQANLNTLLASLSAANASYDAGFFNTTAGQLPNRVYGLFLCRGDVDKETCRDCVKFAVDDTIQRCPVQKETVIWYDQCLLRYSYRSIFSRWATDPALILRNTLNISNEQDRFNQLVASLLNDATKAAASAGPGAKKFAAKKVDFRALQTVYSLVQCTPDLTGLDCSGCLTQAVNQLVACCGIFQGARMFNPSCSIRFELYPFFEDLTISPASAPAAPGSAPHPKSKVAFSFFFCFFSSQRYEILDILLISGLNLYILGSRRGITIALEQLQKNRTTENLIYHCVLYKLFFMQKKASLMR